mmetsp:Transcript_12932/g.14850  ORF Transcript_12932/g.14850 Transcript_12932/m.14850 type:complete len:223 (+) Transcript_12932:5045-5713(+)
MAQSNIGSCHNDSCVPSIPHLHRNSSTDLPQMRVLQVFLEHARYMLDLPEHHSGDLRPFKSKVRRHKRDLLCGGAHPLVQTVLPVESVFGNSLPHQYDPGHHHRNEVLRARPAHRHPRFCERVLHFGKKLSRRELHREQHLGRVHLLVQDGVGRLQHGRIRNVRRGAYLDAVVPQHHHHPDHSSELGHCHHGRHLRPSAGDAGEHHASRVRVHHEGKRVYVQ